MNRWVGIAQGGDSAQYGERKHFGNFPCINVDIILRHSFLRVASQNPLNLPTPVQKRRGGGFLALFDPFCYASGLLL